MPIIDCPSCREKTNTALCLGLWTSEPKAKCIARIVNGRYETGCGYDTARVSDKNYADMLVREQPGVNPAPGGSDG